MFVISFLKSKFLQVNFALKSRITFYLNLTSSETVLNYKTEILSQNKNIEIALELLFECKLVTGFFG